MNPLSTMRFDLAPGNPAPDQPKVTVATPPKASAAAQTACEAKGGKCLNLTPANCADGSWADMTTHSCGTSDGLGCCMPKGDLAKAPPTATAKADPPAVIPAVATAPATAAALAASAQAPAATVAPADTRDTTGFSAAPDPGADEKFSGSTLLVEAYAAIWLVMMAWLFLLWNKSQSLTARLTGLEAAIDRAEKRATKPAAKESPKEKEKEKAPAEEAS